MGVLSSFLGRCWRSAMQLGALSLNPIAADVRSPFPHPAKPVAFGARGLVMAFLILTGTSSLHAQTQPGACECGENGDQLAPFWSISCLLNTSVYTSQGAACPSDATLSLEEGDEIGLFTSWYAGGVEMPSLANCVSDNCASGENLVIRVTDIDYGQESIVINEADTDTEGTDQLEFIELFGLPNTSLDGHVLVFFNGNAANNGSYRAFDLDGYALDEEGYFVIGSSGVANVDYVVNLTNFIQNGPDAIALYVGNGSDWPNGTAPTSLNLLDAIVYNNAAEEDQELLDSLTPGQSQVVETPGSENAFISMSRVPDGGEPFDLSAFALQTPTPGTSNVATAGINLSCSRTITVSFEAEDACGNVSETFTVQVTFHDDLGPEFSYSEVITVECGESTDPEFTGTPVVQDDCNIVSLDYQDSATTGACPASFIRTWTAVDECGNISTATQVITIADSEAPEFDPFEAYFSIECNELDEVAVLTATDNCSEEVTVTYTQTENSGGCIGVIIRTYTATDACGNAATAVQYITLVDTTGPEVVWAPADEEYGCTDEIPGAETPQFTDNCGGEVEIFPASSIVLLDCGYAIHRSWTARDICGNETTVTQNVLVVDNNDPYLVSGEESYSASCNDDSGIPVPVFADVCDEELDMTFEDINLVQAGCAQSFDRVYTFTDDCGNSASFTQHVEIGDDEAPVIEGVDELVEVQCIDDIPGPANATATDNCDSDVDVTVFSSWTGGLTSECEISTAFGPGPDWAFWVPSLSQDGISSSANFHFDANGGHFQQYADGTARLFGTVVNDINANESFVLDMWFENRANWTEWSALGRSYKDDLNCATPQQLYQNWVFWEMVNDLSVAVGQGDLAGVTLQLQHMPANYYFGFQLGQGANNKNCQFGFSGWFTYTGFANCEPISGYGDVNADASCEPVTLESECDTEYTYVYRAIDDSGNITSVEQTIHIEDTIAPEFDVCPASLELTCSSDVPAAPELTATDNCGGEVLIVALPETIEGDEPCNYTITRIWYAEDECGNRSFCTQTITVVDDVAPVFSYVPASITIECDEEVPFENAVASDNCSNVTVTHEDVAQGEACVGQITRVYTAVDECGNTATATQVITITDSEAPVFDPFNPYFAVECDELDEVALLTATDNCSEEVTVTYTQTENSGGCIGVIVRTYTATDGCGNTATAVQYITLLDTTPPTIEAPADQVVECDAIPSLPMATATDNCGLDVTVTRSDEIIEGECEHTYTLVITWTATDYCDNIATATTTLTIVDTTDPVWVYLPADTTVLCSEELPAVEYPVAEDNCDEYVDVEYIEEVTPGDCANEYTLVRIFRAFDDCGNQVLYAQNIFVVDTIAPAFDEQLAYFTFECDGQAPLIQPTATDNCSEEIEYSYEDDNQIVSECEGAIYRTWTATDECGNSSTFVQTLAIVDTTAPVFAGEFEIERPCDDYEGVFVTASDNCDLEVEISYQDEQVSGGCEGRIIRTYTATDNCENSEVFVQIITLTDETLPVAHDVQEGFTVECGDEYEVSAPSFTDNCDEELWIESWSDTTSVDCTTYITYYWSAEDNCDNITEVSTTVTIIDTTAPSLEIPAGYTAECSDELVYESGYAYDICDGVLEVTVSQDTIAGNCPHSYTIIRTFWVADACGNEASAEQFIEVVDTTAPVFGEQEFVFSYECDDQIPTIEPAVSDNCGEVELSYEDDASALIGDCEGFVLRTWTAVDECDNSSTFLQIFNVIDETAPVFAGEVEIERPCDDYEGVYVSASDNCDLEVEISYQDEQVSGGCEGRIIRTYTATDNCENSEVFVQIITLTDETLPVAHDVQEGFTVECGDEYEVSAPSFTDNCDEELWIESWSDTTSVDCTTYITYYWSAQDNCDNTTEVSTTVTIIDTTAPSLEIPAGYTAECSDELVYESGYAYDICDGVLEVTVSQDTIAGDCAYSYTIIRTFWVADACGNEASAEQFIEVVDTTAPVFGEQEFVFSYECDDQIPTIEPAVSDNCGEVELSYEDDASALIGDCEGFVLRTWTAVDECDNSSTFLQIFNVIDETAPVFAGEAEIERPCDDYEGVYVSASDNCDLEVEISYQDEQVSGGCEGRIIRTYTATDNCENSEVFVQIITLTDETLPVAHDVQEGFTVECGDEYEVSAPSFTDNCDEELWIESWSDTTSVDCTTYITYYWSAEDNCENITEVSTTVTIIDTTAPSLEIPAGYTAECSDELVYESAYAYDICDGVLEVTVSQDTIAGDCAYSYTIVRTFWVADACGNEASAEQFIEVVDTTAPVFGEQEFVFSYECDDQIPTIEPAVSDNCGEVELSYEDDASALIGDCEGFVLRTWTAVDECDNSSTFLQIFNVIDETAPVFAGESEIELPCDDYEGVYVTASDNCDLEVEISYTDVEVSGGCQGRIIRTYVATDNCDNTEVFDQIITLVDDVDPVVSNVPASIEVECGEQWNLEAPTFTDNCDDELAINTWTETTTDDCIIVTTYFWSATDNCNNTTVASASVTREDTEAPFFTFVPADDEISCEELNGIELAVADDICDENVAVEVSDEIVPGDCPNSYTIVRTFTAVDHCGNSAVAVQNILVTDTIAPEFTFIPEGGYYSCEDAIEFGSAAASDNCGEATVTFEDSTEEFCANSYILTRTWTATDACLNATSVTVTYVVTDDEAPVFDQQLVDVYVECAGDIPAPVEATATDNCGIATVESSVEVLESDSCGNQIILVSYTAVDECQNTRTASYTIYVSDETAPELSELPEDMVVECGSEWPVAPEIFATDNCDNSVTVTYEEHFFGEDTPAEGSIADCDILTPVRPAGNPCNYPVDWAMALFGMPSSHRYYQVTDGQFIQYPNGTIRVIATMHNAYNPANGFNVDVEFVNGMDWASWTSQNFLTGFKADCGGIAANKTQWMYYLLNNNDATLTGFGAYAGSTLNLAHAPANNYFGFQLGDGASNYNGADNGFGGWFTYSGLFLINGQQVMSGTTTGAGDFAFELDCCPDYSVVRCWTATDCSGNITQHCQTISYQEGAGGTAGQGVEENNSAVPSKEMVQVSPNPAMDITTFKIKTAVYDKVTLEVFDMTGARVASLLNTRAFAGQEFRVNFDVSDLAGGVYMYHFMNGMEMEIGRLIVSK
jgi:large repetitive protein